MSYINVQAAIEEAKKILGEKKDVEARLVIVRQDLRNAVTLKQASKEEAAWIAETFPTKKNLTPAQRAAKLEKDLAAARKAAASEGGETP